MEGFREKLDVAAAIGLERLSVPIRNVHSDRPVEPRRERGSNCPSDGDAIVASGQLYG